MKYAPLVVVALLLGACETLPTGTQPAAGRAGLEGQLDLGEWRTASEAATLSAFTQNVSNRYAPGLALSDATNDLQHADFTCGPAPPLDRGRGSPPAQVCRRTITSDGCTHTWQVHVFAQDGVLSTTRGLYDRRCGNEGLLGGAG